MVFDSVTQNELLVKLTVDFWYHWESVEWFSLHPESSVYLLIINFLTRSLHVVLESCMQGS